MAAIKNLNPKAEVARRAQALAINTSAARGLQDVLRTNLGPKGTMKMLVSGAGDIKLTKDGNVLLHEMQIQHPTASLIARVATAQDDQTGDGTTSTVLLIGELLKQADIHVSEGLHPRLLTQGYELAKDKVLELIESSKLKMEMDCDVLKHIARASLATKINKEMAGQLAEIVVNAVLCVRGGTGDTDSKEPLDLHMVELMEMQQRTDADSELIRGLVLDHGTRHPDMPKRLSDAFVLTCNVSLEYEKSEVNSGFFYKSAEEREKLVMAERAFIDERVEKIVALKNEVCAGTDKTFLLVNQKGIDPLSLDVLAKAGIMGLRRAKRRNMERLVMACGGTALNSFDGLDPSCLGHAGTVYEQVLGEDKFTFVEDVEQGKSCTILLKGPNKHTLVQMKDAIRDGLRSVKNALDDGSVLPGGGAFEMTAHRELQKFQETVKGRARLGVQAFAEALLIVPKTLAQNSGFDAQDVIVKLQEFWDTEKRAAGVNVNNGEPMDPVACAIFDNVNVKRQMIASSCAIATNLLLVDEIMRAGMSSLKGD